MICSEYPIEEYLPCRYYISKQITFFFFVSSFNMKYFLGDDHLIFVELGGFFADLLHFHILIFTFVHNCYLHCVSEYSFSSLYARLSICSSYKARIFNFIILLPSPFPFKTQMVVPL